MKVRIAGVVRVLVLSVVAGMVALSSTSTPAGACEYNWGGGCSYPPWASGTVSLDCDCDIYGCPGGPEGPPYYVCVVLSCNNLRPQMCWTVPGEFRHETCRPVTDLSITCPCEWINCLFDY